MGIIYIQYVHFVDIIIYLIVYKTLFIGLFIETRKNDVLKILKLTYLCLFFFLNIEIYHKLYLVCCNRKIQKCLLSNVRFYIYHLDSLSSNSFTSFFTLFLSCYVKESKTRFKTEIFSIFINEMDCIIISLVQLYVIERASSLKLLLNFLIRVFNFVSHQLRFR